MYGAKLELVCIVWTEVRPTSAPKHLEIGIVWCGAKKAMDRSVIV
jgi:hypothetical protein